LQDGGGVVFVRCGAMELSRVLMRFALAVTGKHGGLLVHGGGAPVRLAGAEMPFRGVSMRPSGSFQRFDGVQAGAFCGHCVGRKAGRQFGSALLQFARAFARRLSPDGCGIPTGRAGLGHGHQL
jgi:hypothetical protein